MLLLKAFLVIVIAIGNALPGAATHASCKSEDSPGWNWSQCGNHRRGVLLSDGKGHVVGCPGYCDLVLNGQLSRRNPRLRGDATCLAA